MQRIHVYGVIKARVISKCDPGMFEIWGEEWVGKFQTFKDHIILVLGSIPVRGVLLFLLANFVQHIGDVSDE